MFPQNTLLSAAMTPSQVSSPSSTAAMRPSTKRATSPLDDAEDSHIPKRARLTRQESEIDARNSNGNDESSPGNEACGDVKIAKEPQTNKTLICDFCKNHPHGQYMHLRRPCDWTSVGGKYVLECQNCADYRFEYGVQHVCCVGRKKQTWRIYATRQPLEYPRGLACDNCRQAGYANTCDADPYLGLSCTSCVTAKPSPAEKAKHALQEQEIVSGRKFTSGFHRPVHECNTCRVGDRVLEHKPNLRQGFPRWFRHACDICRNRGKKKNDFRCSWLDSRANWDKACSRCTEKNMMCMSSGQPVDKLQVPVPSDRWATSHSLLAGWAECRGGSPYRQGCRTCLDGTTHHCRALASEIEYSCAMCWEMGIVCWDTKNPAQGKSFPIFDFSRVGLGNLCTFSKCTRCKDTGRNCDRQRPCDSCVSEANDTGDACCCDDVKDGYNCVGRLQEAPGPIYYLALGYGSEGVNDVKDGSKMEHWIGPAFPLYGIDKKPPTEDEKRALAHGKALRMELLAKDLRETTDAASRTREEAIRHEVAGDEYLSDADAASTKPVGRKRKATSEAQRATAIKSENKMTLASIAHDMRKALLPPGQPPLGTDSLPNVGPSDPRVHGLIRRVQDKRIDQLSAAELAAMISAKWPGGPLAAYPPNRHAQYAETVDQGKRAVQDLRAGKKPSTTHREPKRRRGPGKRERARPAGPKLAANRYGRGNRLGCSQRGDVNVNVDLNLRLSLEIPVDVKWQGTFDEEAETGGLASGVDQTVFGSDAFWTENRPMHPPPHNVHQFQGTFDDLDGRQGREMFGSQSFLNQDDPVQYLAGDSFLDERRASYLLAPRFGQADHYSQPSFYDHASNNQEGCSQPTQASAMEASSSRWSNHHQNRYSPWAPSDPTALGIRNYQLPSSHPAQVLASMTCYEHHPGVSTVHPLDLHRHGTTEVWQPSGPGLLPDSRQPMWSFLGYPTAASSSAQDPGQPFGAEAQLEAYFREDLGTCRVEDTSCSVGLDADELALY
ncbi:hypothetical protein E4U22_007889 [Claviceps purpurea]|nr:hypothetical protein E4U22_007889 [Claviceps purpurea]